MADDVRLTDAEWRAFQAIPDQGYSHRDWLDVLIAARLQTAHAEDAARLAEVWDEGYDACWNDQDSGAFPGEQTSNPYRAAALGVTAPTASEAGVMETGRQLASQRDDLIARGVNPADLAVPIAPAEASEVEGSDSRG